MAFQKEILLPFYGKGMHDISSIVGNELPALPGEGLLHIFVKHTSAGITISENADGDVQSDLMDAFERIAPCKGRLYRHSAEGPDDMPAHILSSLTGSSVLVPVSKGKLNLGTWQGIYLCEFRNRPVRRQIVLTLIA